jgi:hypothetical protein
VGPRLLTVEKLGNRFPKVYELRTWPVDHFLSSCFLKRVSPRVVSYDPGRTTAADFTVRTSFEATNVFREVRRLEALFDCSVGKALV